MPKMSFIYYYVQSLHDQGSVKIVYHSSNGDEHYYKFLDKKKAVELAKKEKEADPNLKFRVVKYTETYEDGPWF